jgi:hypothetical protein
VLKNRASRRDPVLCGFFSCAAFVNALISLNMLRFPKRRTPWLTAWCLFLNTLVKTRHCCQTYAPQKILRPKWVCTFPANNVRFISHIALNLLIMLTASLSWCKLVRVYGGGDIFSLIGSGGGR